MSRGTYRSSKGLRYPCISVDSDGDLYVETSEGGVDDTYIRLSFQDKLALIDDLLQAARQDMQAEAKVAK